MTKCRYRITNPNELVVSEIDGFPVTHYACKCLLLEKEGVERPTCIDPFSDARSCDVALKNKSQKTTDSLVLE